MSARPKVDAFGAIGALGSIYYVGNLAGTMASLVRLLPPAFEHLMPAATAPPAVEPGLASTWAMTETRWI